MNGKKYKIKIGGSPDDEKTGKVIKKVKEEDLINKYGYNRDIGGDSWDVVLIGGITRKDSARGDGVGDAIVVATKLYAGDDDYEKGNEATLNEGSELREADITRASEVGGILKNTLNDVIAKLFIMLIEFARNLYGDVPQMLVDSIQTTQYGTGISKFLPWKITYKSDEYINPDKNAYVKFSSDGSNEGADWQKKIEVSANENKFDEKTEIPVIPVDIYTLAVGQVSAFDINFLTGQNNTILHSSDSIWTKFRNLAAGIIHITIYIGATFLIATLIWHGICIVKGTFTPEGEKKHKEGLQNFAIAVAMLVGSILIMALCIFSSKIVFEDMIKDSEKELPIRVVLKDSANIYSFSTNITGYVRYLSETQSTSLITQKLKYTIVYIIFVWLNIMAVIIMLIRMVAIIILSILGPIIAVAYAMKKQGVFNITYKTWIIHYALWSSIQLIFAIACRIILEVSF